MSAQAGSSKIDIGGDEMSVGVLSESSSVAQSNYLSGARRRGYSPEEFRRSGTISDMVGVSRTALNWEWPLTAAIGVRFYGGIVLCADSQITYGNGHKRIGSKVAYSSPGNGDYVLAVTGAGVIAFMEEFFQNAADSIELGDRSVGAAKSSLQKSLIDIYSTAIDPYRRRYGGDDGEIEMIISYRSPSGESAFWKTLSASLLRASSPECVGSGGPIAKFIAGPMCHDKLRRESAVAIGVNAIRYAKNLDSKCGGPTLVAVVLEKGSAHLLPQLRIGKLEDFLSKCDLASSELIVKCSDIAVADDEIEQAYNAYRAEVERLSEELRGPLANSLRKAFGPPCA